MPNVADYHGSSVQIQNMFAIICFFYQAYIYKKCRLSVNNCVVTILVTRLTAGRFCYEFIKYCCGMKGYGSDSLPT